MLVRQTFKVVLAAVCALGGAACKKELQDNRAEQERIFRERQRALAIKTYKDLATNFPDTEYAPLAKKRLDALQAQQTK